MREPTARLREMMSIFLITMTAIGVLFVARMTVNLHAELGRVKAAVQAIRTDPMTRAAALQPFAVFEEQCVSCNSDRKFLGAHGSTNELKQIIDRMEQYPDAHVTVQDREKIHASLMLLKCVRCHDEVNLKKLVPMSGPERMEILRKMKEKPGSEIAPEDAKEILRAYQKIQGF